MFFRRAAYVLLLLALAACAVLTGNALFGLLAAAGAALIFISLILFLSAVGRFHLRIDLPESAAKNTEFAAHIRVDAGAFADSLHIALHGRCVNLLCGESLPLPVRSPDANLRGGTLALSLNSPRCGKLTLEISRAEITDPLGLFRKKINLQTSASVLILPEPFDMAITLSEHHLPFADSEEYSPDRPGGDPSELFGIRDYREGDALKHIHWKLSEKYDRTVVREMSLPVSHAVLLMPDNCPSGEIDPDAACAACEALIGCSLALTEMNAFHRIAWFNRETELVEVRGIASSDDLYGELGALLAARFMKDEIGLTARILNGEPIEYSRLMIFAAAETRGIDALDGEVTLISTAPDAESAICCRRDAITQLTI